MRAALEQLAERAWRPAISQDGHERKGAWVAELTGTVKLDDWLRARG